MAAPRKRASAKKAPARMAAAAPPASQRARLMGRPRPSSPYRLLVDADRVVVAREALARVQAESRQVRLREAEGSAAYKAAEKTVAEAEAAVDACYETVQIQALPPPRVAELEDEHPATEEQMARTRKARETAGQRGEEPPDWPSFADSFWPVVLAESCDNGMSVADWSSFLAGSVSDGELRGLQRAVLQVNAQERVADPLVLPKGLMGMLS